MSRVTKLFAGKSEYDGGQRTWQEEYLQLLLTNTLDNTFYARAGVLLEKSAEKHELAANEDPQFMAKALVYARNYGYMRLQPIYGLAVLSGVSSDLFKQIFPLIILTPGDLADLLQIVGSMERGQDGRLLKRLGAEFLNGLKEYGALKYGGKGRGFSVRDMIRTLHPKARDAKQNALFKYCCKFEKKDLPELKEILPQIYAYESLKRTEDTQEQVTLIKQGRLPHNLVTGVVEGRKEIWQALMFDLPLLALIRHLQTLHKHGLLADNLVWLEERLTNAHASCPAPAQGTELLS